MGSVRYTSRNIVLDPERWQVRVDGEVTTPEPKVFETLSYLMRHAGRVVSKAELLDSVWAGSVVGESVLTRCVSYARKLLSDDAKTPRFIRTLQGHGYEFIAPVTVQLDPSVEIKRNPSITPEEVSDLATPHPDEQPFLGRKAEMLRLVEAIRRVELQSPDFILVTGEAGIGKTRLLDQVTQHASPSLEVHWGRCSPIEGAPPFLMWQQCFRSIARQRSTKTVLRAFSDAGSDARKLLFGADRWQVEDHLGWDSPNKRFRTFDCIARGFLEIARQRALVLVFDDLHAADLASLLLLEFLSQKPFARMLLLGTLRDPEPVPDASRARTLSTIRASCRTEIALSGFSHDEVKQFVRVKFEREHDQLAESLFVRTGGNPFFLSVLTPTQDLSRIGDTPLSSAVRQAVSNRLASLEAACVRLLRLAAAYGRDFDGLALARAAEMSMDQCVRLLTAACAARTVISTGATGYRFAHDLIREVLYAEMDVDEQARSHLAIGRTLETVQHYQEARNASALAHHFVRAAHSGGATRAIDLSIRAGAYALRHFAYEEAIQHFMRANALLAVSTETDSATECAVLLDLGLSQVSAGQREAGQSTLHLAATKARELGAPEELASVALNLAPGLFAIETGVYDPVLVGLLREALQQVPQSNDRLRALLLARLALAMYWSDTFQERVAICDEAQKLAEKVNADDVRAAVTTARLFALLRPRGLKERLDLSGHAVELCLRVGDYHGLLINRLLRVAMLLESGDVTAASFEADAFRKLAEETNQPQALWIVQAHRASRLLQDGQLEEVERLAGRCWEVGQRVRDHNALLTFGVHLFWVRIEQGRTAEVLEGIRDFAARYPRLADCWRIGHAYALSRAGQIQACAVEYESFKASGFSLPDDLTWLARMALLSELCHAQRDAVGARTLYERLAPFAARFVVVGYGGIACYGSVQRYLGLLCATLNRQEAAEQYFKEALFLNRRASASLPLAHTLCDYAALLREAGPERAAEAQACLGEAEALARERNWVALLARLLDQSGQRAPVERSVNALPQAVEG